MADERETRKKFRMLLPSLNERTRRLWVAAEAKACGRGGIACVIRATGVSYNTVAKGILELKSRRVMDVSRIRRPGGGRKPTCMLDPKLREDLDHLVDPVTRGDPESPLRWTCKSVRHLAEELGRMGHPVSHRLVATLLHEMGYSLQANRKTKEGGNHPDRNAQFEYINRRVCSQIKHQQPAISVDAKKKELVGNFKNGGREWQPKGQPEKVGVYDFINKGQGKVIPYGVYDLAHNTGWVSVGVDHDTGAFAVGTIRRWWREMGKNAYPDVRHLLVIADGGGSNGSRVRLWKWELQKLANQTGVAISVCHLPPGTSKWNKIEHRLFSYISRNWRGRPLLTHAIIVNLIAGTTTQTGLKVRCVLDTKRYPAKLTITDEQMAQINIKRDAFHGEWNYTILPNDQ